MASPKTQLMPTPPTSTATASAKERSRLRVAPVAPAAAPAITPRDPMIVLGYRCLNREFRALRKKRPDANATPSSEDIHQMRIATRRARVALRLFGYMLPKRAAHELKRELRWLAQALGQVRDLDVHEEALHSYLGTSENQPLGGYELDIRRDRTAARNELRTLFAGERYAKLMTSFAALLEKQPSPGALRRWRSFDVKHGAQQLEKTRKRVIKLGRKLGPHAAAAQLHRLRIRTKRLRYEIEFFLEAYPALAPAAKAAKSLQDLLGVQQDASTARARIAKYLRTAGSRTGAIPPALDRWRMQQTEQSQAARRELPGEWKRFVSATDTKPLA